MTMSMFETHGEFNEWELGGELAGESEAFETYETHETGEMNEMLEMELVNELLEITSEAELEQFLGKLVRSVGKAASGFIKSPIGKALGGVLRNVAKTALPMVGSALGSFVAPGLGTALGGKLGAMAGNLLEVQELEAMGEAEAEFEMARRYVQWARGTTRNALRAPYGVNPNAAVRAAAVSSARRYAPALLRQQPRSPWRSRRQYAGGPGYYPSPSDGWAGAGATGADDGGLDGGTSEQSGRWVRRGSQIILLGV
jgi:uncharacterized protein (DUF697 family)